MKFFTLTLIILAGDQLSKNWVVLRLQPGESWPLIDNVLHLTHVRNPGAAFGILAFRTSFFIIVSLLMIFLILSGERLFPRGNSLLHLGMSLLLGGAIGNLIDRIRFGYVIDFLDIRVWPVFNVADIALVLGVIALGFGLHKIHFFSCSD
ncbi:MAG TPA: signal peptidase II [Firmicutes bacterium]|nr:signal peptidase II [Bacillota bacterium]